MVHAEHFSHVLGIELPGESGRADEIAEHHSELAPLRTGRRRGGALGLLRRQPIAAAQRADRPKQFSPMADRADPETDQIVGGKLRQHPGIDVIVAKTRLVALEA